MNATKAVLWTFVVLCAAVFAICVYVDPDSVADTLEHCVLHMVYVGMLLMLADLTIRYKE